MIQLALWAASTARVQFIILEHPQILVASPISFFQTEGEETFLVIWSCTLF